MLSFFILTASAATAAASDDRRSTRYSDRSRGPTNSQYDDDSYAHTDTTSAELWDFLGVRIWQELGNIFPTNTSDSNKNSHNQKTGVIVQHYFSEFQKLLKKLLNRKLLGLKTNIALVIIDDGINPYLIPKLFLSIGHFEQPKEGVSFENRQTSIANEHKQNINLTYTSVYQKEDSQQQYIDNLEDILDSKRNLENPHDLLGFREIFLNEIFNDNNPNYNYFNLNWHHSEQGFLQWLNREISRRYLPKKGDGSQKYRIIILTRNAMCLRCSTTFFLQKKHLANLFGAQSVEIISISINDYTDKLGEIPQTLVFDNQSQISYHNHDSHYLIRGIVENEEEEE